MAIIFHMETITDEDFHCSGVKNWEGQGEKWWKKPVSI